MKIPGLPAALRTNLADLTRLRRGLGAVMPKAGPVAAGRLEDVAAFGANPGNLRMLRYLPPGLRPGAPLVVVLHGCTQTAAGYDHGAGWSELAERHGFALLFPEQLRGNNQNTCFNWFDPGDIARGTGEVASIRGMVARMQADRAIDPARVFVTGLSAGGAMASALLATYPDVFAAGAIIAGLPFGCAAGVGQALGAMRRCPAHTPREWGDMVRRASPAPQRKPIVSLWHGDADATVTPAAAVEHAKQWCDVHGLGEAAATRRMVDGVPHQMWRDAGGTVRVELFMVPGLGHGTPLDLGGSGERGVGHAMPYMLDAGIPSTWHIARGWGLVPG